MAKVWLIGASEGIGRALAKELADSNELIISARNQDRLDELVNSHPIKQAVAVDVTQQQSIKQAYAKIGAIDMLIYSAGYYQPMSATDINISDVEKMIEVNLTGALRVISTVLPSMIQRKQGKIVLIGSIAAYRGLPNAIGYGASKAGILHLGENLFVDLKKHGIDVQVISPGFVKTRLTDLNTFHMPSIMTPEQAAKHIHQRIKSGRFESRFPFLFANFLRMLSYLPYRLYFKMIDILM